MVQESLKGRAPFMSPGREVTVRLGQGEMYTYNPRLEEPRMPGTRDVFPGKWGWTLPKGKQWNVENTIIIRRGEHAARVRKESYDAALRDDEDEKV